MSPIRGWAAACIALGLMTSGPIRAAELEAAPIFRASEILPAELAASDDHRVVEMVRNDGFMHLFRIETEFGDFEARGLPMLAVRVHEIHALAQLSELSKTEVFAKAAARAATAQVETVKEFAARPVETVKGMPGGVKRMFKKYKRDAKELEEDVEELTSSDDESEGDGEGGQGQSSMETAKELGGEAAEAGSKYAKRYFGLNRSERMWAERLEIDPYTSNERLLTELERVARVDAAGGFTMKFAPIPRIPGVGYIHDVNKLVWSMDPRELRELNMKRMAEMGVEEELMNAFLENPALTPSRQTRIVAALTALPGAADRRSAIEQAAGVESDAQAAFFDQSMALLDAYDGGEGVVTRFVGRTRVPVVQTVAGTLVAFTSVDHVSWTEETREIATEFLDAYRDIEAAGRELRLRGASSELFRDQMRQRGWSVVDRVVAASD